MEQMQKEKAMLEETVNDLYMTVKLMKSSHESEFSENEKKWKDKFCLEKEKLKSAEDELSRIHQKYAAIEDEKKQMVCRSSVIYRLSSCHEIYSFLITARISCLSSLYSSSSLDAFKRWKKNTQRQLNNSRRFWRLETLTLRH